MSKFYMMEAVNLFAGNADPTQSKHLTIAEMKLPDMTETFADHRAGGARVGIEVPVGLEKLEATFKLNGIDPQLMTLFGLGSRAAETYTGYGSVMDKQTGRSFQSKAVMTGRLGRVSPDTFQRGELQGHEYMISGITHYEFVFDGEEKYYFDFFANIWRVDGVDQNADMNANLGIAG